MPSFSGQRLRDARKNAGLSREKVAVAAGVSVSSVERWEQGGSQPLVEAAVRVAAVLEVTINDLFDVPVGALA
jgi:transcriptional regulator with XRE-family HTH domain